jgi:hypothetical protein
MRTGFTTFLKYHKYSINIRFYSLYVVIFFKDYIYLQAMSLTHSLNITRII